MFNSQAFISTLVFILLLFWTYMGFVFAAYHRWWFARIIGGLAATLAVAGIVAHTVALIAGA